MNAINTVATRRRVICAKSLFYGVFVAVAASVALLGGCSALPDKPVRTTLYDFGPGMVDAQHSSRMAALPPIALADVEPAGVLEGSTTVLYRLAYADGLQLRPYAMARWSVPPAQLVRQTLREQLGLRRAVLNAGESAALVRVDGRLPLVVRVDLEEFSQLFTSPASSVGVVRLRVTLADNTPAGEQLLGQRSFAVQRAAASADAAGGVKALADASNAAAVQIAEWLVQTEQARPLQTPAPALKP